MKAELVAERRLPEVWLAAANDARRSTFSVIVTGGLIVLAGDDLSVLHRWRLPSETEGWGCHSVLAANFTALLSTPEEVRLVDRDGSTSWAYPHESWRGHGQGCTWFDAMGTAFAVVPSGTGAECMVVELDPESGRLVAGAQV